MRSLGIIFILLAGLISANFICASETIDINSASLEELTEIIHIGEARGKELISLRPFHSLDDLARINGISQGRVEDIKKQGLAWVDPGLSINLKSSELDSKSISQETDAAQGADAPTENKNEERQADNPPPLSLYIGAGIMATFSGATILILKKKSKKEYNNIEL